MQYWISNDWSLHCSCAVLQSYIIIYANNRAFTALICTVNHGVVAEHQLRLSMLIPLHHRSSHNTRLLWATNRFYSYQTSAIIRYVCILLVCFAMNVSAYWARCRWMADWIWLIISFLFFLSFLYRLKLFFTGMFVCIVCIVCTVSNCNIVTV